MKYTIPAGNYATGRGNYAPEAFVIHIQQGNQAGTISWFQNPASEVSSHVAVSKAGAVDNFVAEEDTAYHAGRINQPVWGYMKKTLWGGWVNPNLYTVGVECEGFRGEGWTEAQMAAVCGYVKLIAGRYGIPLTRARIVSHNEITADKEDMRTWCDEIVRRLNQPAPTPPAGGKQELVGLLEQALQKAKNL